MIKRETADILIDSLVGIMLRQLKNHEIKAFLVGNTSSA